MAGGSFPFSAVSRYTPTGEARLVLNVGFVPEVSASSCSLKCLCMEHAKAGYGMDGLALTDGSTSGGGVGVCEASSSWGRFSELDGCEVLRFCSDPSSSTVAGDHVVLNRPKSSVSGTYLMDAFNATCNSNCASPCISWNGQSSQSLSAYVEASCTTANNLNLLPDESPSLRGPNSQRAASYGSHVRTANPSQGRCREFKPDDASSHNNNNMMLCERSRNLEPAFAAENDRDLEMEELAALSESINDSLLQQKGRGEEGIKNFVKGSKRKATDVLKNPEVQSEERTQNESRIVRVSRLTGGKDRHSKVKTARGLRDRRVRLSVPTAIQFYDLQDRLGFEQPSMAVDWLINNAKTAIDSLPQIADASNCSPVKSGVESPKDGATAAVAQPTAHEVGVKKNEKRILTSGVKILTSKNSCVGRSSSSTSDGSIMGTEYSSKCSLSKLARLKVARERARKKARNSAASSQVQSINMVTGHLMNVTSHGSVAQDSCCGRNGILSGTGNIQQLWDYSMQDISCKEDSHQFQRMASASLSSTLTAAEMQTLVRSSSHQNFDMADFTTAFVDPRQRSVVGNPAQMYFNSLIDHQPQAMQKHLGSTFVPSDVSFTMSDDSSRGPLQSNSSCITTGNTPVQKNTFADASAKVSMLPFLAYDPFVYQNKPTFWTETPSMK